MEYFLLFLTIILGLGVFVTLIWIFSLHCLEKQDKGKHQYFVNFPNNENIILSS